ncbi:MAG TPA: hypothetical protein VJS44_02555 [Pyrinomonadaceae bacterium]|nr:hypothetical protein [Pyrinomonadaceae bacterium]
MKRMRSLQIILFITMLAATCAFAQKKQKDAPVVQCPLQQAPDIRGFRLGMPLMDVKGALEDASLFDTKLSGDNKVGSRAVRLQGSELKGDNAEGVDDVDLVFVDERLSNVKVNFNSGMRWDSAQDFFTKMSETLGLPKPAGEESRGANQRNQKYTVECATFSVTLTYSFGVTPSVAIIDTAAQRKVGDRQERNPDGEVRTIDLTPRGRPRQPPR